MESYFKAVHPEPYRILGLTLKPLSLGRYQLLKRFNCVFVAEEPAMPRPGDLLLGVFICSFRCDEFLALLDAGKFVSEMERWGEKIFKTGPWRKYLPKRFQRPEPFNYLDKVVLFKRYLSDGAAAPDYFEIESGGNVSGAHWSQSVEVVLRGELGWTLEEVQEAPLSKAISDYYKFLENKGMIALVSDLDRELMKAAEANAAILAGN